MSLLIRRKNKKEKEEVFQRIKDKRLCIRLLQLLVSLLISSFLFNLLIFKLNIVTGGINGIAVIFNEVYHIDPSITIFLLSLLLLIASYFFLGLEKSLGTVLATFLYPFLVKLISLYTSNIAITTNDSLLLVIYIGIIGGFANGLMYKSGYSNGGLPIISQILYKRFRIATSKSSFYINGIIVIIGGLIFSWTNVLYAFLILYINSYIIERVVIGIYPKKAFYIITEEDEKIRNYIVEKLNHSVTIISIESSYLSKCRKMVLTVIPMKDYEILKKAIKKIDSNSFFLICEAYQSVGGK